MTKSYYVYEHYRGDDGEIFYVGKGTSLRPGDYRRAFDFWRRKKSWVATHKKHGAKAFVVAEFENENDALDFEASLIAKYGRRDLGIGPLINHTDGGKGSSGYKMHPDVVAKLVARNTGRPVSQETREKISQANSGDRHWKFGTVEPAEVRAKKSESMRGKNMAGKTVIDRSTGNIFASICEAARFFNMPHRTLTNYLNGERKNKTAMEFA